MLFMAEGGVGSPASPRWDWAGVRSTDRPTPCSHLWYDGGELPEIELAERGRNAIEIPDDDGGHAIGIEIAPRRRRHIVERHAVEHRHEVFEVGVGQIVQRE